MTLSVSPTSASTNVGPVEQDYLPRRLTNLEVIIDKLLLVRPRPDAIIKEHIQQLEESIVDLPACGVDGDVLGDNNGALLADQFRDKVVRFWQRFSAHREPPEDRENADDDSCSSADSKAPAVPARKDAWPSKPPPQMRLSYHYSRNFGRVVKQIQLGRGPPQYHRQARKALAPGTFGALDEQPEELRAKFKQAFAQLAFVDRNTNVPAMKQLLLLVAKARNLIVDYYWHDYGLLDDIFRLAFSKMSASMQKRCDKFALLNYPKNNLWRLQLFIQTRLENFSCDAAAAERVLGIEGFYEALTGAPHQKHEHSLCYKCLAFGHISRDCAARKMLVRVEDLFSFEAH